MRTIRSSAVLAGILAGHVSIASADSSLGSAEVTVSAKVAARAAVRPSAETLLFHVADPAAPVNVTIGFAAGARVRPEDEVQLVVLSESPLPLTFVSSDGTVNPVERGTPVVVLRWAGGGRKDGALTFRLLAAPGTHAIPIRIFLIVP